MGKARRRKQERPEPAARPRAPRAPAMPRPRFGWTVAVPALLVAGTAAYANSFSIPFLFDDYIEILRNPMVERIDSLLGYLTQARGLTALTFALNHRWGGRDVWGYHLVNLIVHLLNGLLVYTLVRTTLRLPRFAARYATNASLLALLAALIFLLHPLQTMAVSYLTQRTESLATFFYLAGLLLFVRASLAEGGWRTPLYAAALLVAFLGVVSKQTVATLPVAALLYSACFLGGERRTSAAWLVLVVLMILPVAYALDLSRAYLFPGENLAPGEPRAWLFIPSAGFQLEGVTPGRYLMTQFGVIVWYLRLVLLPTAQCFDYGWPLASSFWSAGVLLPLLVLFALLGAAVAAFRRHPIASFCIGWFFVTLAPSSSLIPLRDAAFEHRMYLPMVGLSFLTVVGGHDLLGALARRFALETRTVLRAGGAALGLWLLLLAALTAARNHVYQDRLRLAADTAAKAPGNWRAHFETGAALLERGQAEEAIPPFERAVALAPDRGAPRVQLGELYARNGRLDDAEAVLDPAVRDPEESVAAAAQRVLGFVALARHDRGTAMIRFEDALRLKPSWSSVREQLAELYSDEGLWFGAAGQFNRLIRGEPALASRLGPRAAEANYRTGIWFLQSGKPKAAIRTLSWALGYRPAFPAARHYLALSHAAAGQWDEAEVEIARVAAESPGDALVAENVARIRDRRPPIDPASGEPFEFTPGAG